MNAILSQSDKYSVAITQAWMGMFVAVALIAAVTVLVVIWMNWMRTPK